MVLTMSTHALLTADLLFVFLAFDGFLRRSDAVKIESLLISVELDSETVDRCEVILQCARFIAGSFGHLADSCSQLALRVSIRNQLGDTWQLAVCPHDRKKVCSLLLFRLRAEGSAVALYGVESGRKACFGVLC